MAFSYVVALLQNVGVRTHSWCELSCRHSSNEVTDGAVRAVLFSVGLCRELHLCYWSCFSSELFKCLLVRAGYVCFSPLLVHLLFPVSFFPFHLNVTSLFTTFLLQSCRDSFSLFH